VSRKLGGTAGTADELIAQDSGGPRVGNVVAKAIPALWASVEASRKDATKLPALYYDFAIRKLCRVTPDLGRPQNTRVEGFLFVQHRFEPRPFVIAVPLARKV
jgi:hypothetical protein